MRIRATSLIAAIVLAAGTAHAAQNASVPSSIAIGLTEIQPSVAEGAWVLQVVSRGGFSGATAFNLVATSTGELACAANVAPCPKALSAAQVEQLAQLVPPIAPQWTVAPASTCSGCVERIVLLRLREGGMVRTDVARWDDSQPVPADARRLYDFVATLRRSF